MTVWAPSLQNINSRSDLTKVSDLLNGLKRHPIAISPWKGYTAPVTATFSIAHGQDCILLKYFVSEPFSIPLYHKINDPVYKDSCVEFFIGFNQEPKYYNFEFNNEGTGLMGFGTKNERAYLAEAVVRQIKYSRSFKNAQSENLACWELALVIPFTVFCFHQINAVSSILCKGNFFKCGDDLPQPHYLVWNNIHSPKPDFHQPEFFGTIDFG
ncbi:carbohydrate-binding family 9-like protein [Pedobacter africanus]|uniref:Carbohydrate-binding family 9 n=1 Tax=Pedobacter africanus TaxID=151894 RepID=A0A1W2BJI2_9SPHI|nr:carbohydrate-binding family 9-like protein [Pedobacter africanus]SMC73074.1 Carbohydrate-binding family 9 [Pedobacter africanus]